MLKPLTRVAGMCSDVIPITAWEKAKKEVLKCTTPQKPWYKPWIKQKEPTCIMSTLSDQYKKAEEQAKAKAAKKTTKKTSK